MKAKIAIVFNVEVSEFTDMAKASKRLMENVRESNIYFSDALTHEFAWIKEDEPQFNDVSVDFTITNPEG